MNNSFKTWRESTNRKVDIDNENDSDSSQDLVGCSDNESDSEVVDSSIVNSFVVPDSDESFNSEKHVNTDSSKNILSVVADSGNQLIGEKIQNYRESEFVPLSDESDRSSFQQLSSSETTNSRRSKSSYSGSVCIKNSTPKQADSPESSPEIAKIVKKKNKQRLSSESSVGQSNVSMKNYNISVEASEAEVSGSNTSPSYCISESEESTKEGKSQLEISKREKMPIIDLTLPIREDHSKGRKLLYNFDLTGNVKGGNGHLTENKGIINIISSDSEEEKVSHSQQEHLNVQLKKLSIAQNIKTSNPSREFQKEASSHLHKSSENDHESRLSSMIAEETRLKAQVGEVLQNIETTKRSLSTANLALLPDRGTRLQMNLKRLESKLRDLRYQQNTLSNEVIKLQMAGPKTSVPKPKPSQLPQQKMFKLPTADTDINAMGKRAMETHRTQQALTIDALRSLHNSLKNCPSEDTLASDPQGIKVELMPHQKYALSWLMWREKETPSGGILADDMGLGKTLTMISLILKSHEERQDDDDDNTGCHENQPDEAPSSWLSSQRPKVVPGKTLVVCPASLIGQWEGEVQRRLKRGTIDVLVHHGSNREKKATRLARQDLVITTYNIVARDANKVESPLLQVKWRRVILDEAHQIRNYKTQTAEGVFKLKARSRWVLTGTPVQNKELDLYALLKFLRCAPFDDLGVWKRWVDNRDAAGQQRLNTIIKSIMLRRTKAGLQEIGALKGLTEKKFNTVFVTMDKDESAGYEKLLNFSKTLFAQFLHQKAEKENALQGIPIKPKNLHNAEDPFKDHPELARLHRKMQETVDVKSHHILVLLLRLRQFCCHPSLIKSMLEKEDMRGEGIEDGDGLDIDLMDKFARMSLVKKAQQNEDVDTDVALMDKDNPLFAEDRLSSKMRKVMDAIDCILKSGDKMLVVSQWVSHLHLLYKVLKEKNIKCLTLTGQVPVKDRAEIVEKFNKKDNGRKVLLLSLTAGGVGLNLVGGNHLLLLDLHWNPQLENQACDRIYRVGQEKNVQIYKFVTAESIEESILKLQQKKVCVADQVLTGAKHTSKLSLDDLKMLFQMK